MRRWWPGWVAAAAGTAVFAWCEISTSGWSDLHLHSGGRGGRPWIQLLPPQEGVLYLALLAMVPAIVLLGGRLGASAGLATAWRWAIAHRRGVVWTAAGGAVLAALAVGHLVVRRTPLTDDEQAYLFQARVMAGGRLTAPSPDARPFYDNIFLVNDGRWYAQYPVGSPLLLAAGVRAGDPWLIPPLLIGLAVLLTADAARRLAGPGAAVATAVLAATSPFLLGVGGTLLAHAACLAALAGFLSAGLRATGRHGRPGWAAAAALAFGWAVLVRPSSAVMVGLPLIGLLGVRLARSRRRLACAAAFFGVGAVMLGVQLAVNTGLTGHPLHSGYVAYWQPREGWRSPFGFGRFPWGLLHTPRIAWGNLWHNLVRLNAWLLGWPASLAVAAAGLWAGAPRLGRARWWLLAAGVLPFVVQFFYFWPGISDVGPVLYLESAVVWLPLADIAVARGPRWWRPWIRGAVPIALVVAGLTFHRVQATALARITEDAGTARRLEATIPAEERALVFCPRYLRPGRQRSWVAGRPDPWPDLRDRVLFVQWLGPEASRRFWQSHHPDRVPYELHFQPGRGLWLEPTGWRPADPD